MITYNHKCNNGIFGGSKTKFNSELIEQAQKSNHHIPGGYYPAVMERQYLENDFEKFRKSYVWNPDPLRWVYATEAFETIFQNQMRAETMTFQDAVSKMELSASPGFPWNEKYKTKRDCLQPESQGGCLELIEDIVNQIFDKGEFEYEFNGKTHSEVYWQTSPKEEIRPIEKIKNEDVSKQKTRTFMCGDLVTHIVGFMLYKNQNDNMILRNPPNSWIGVGINPWYGGWHRMCESLLRNKSKKFHCEDANHMEASVNKVIQTLIYKVRNRNVKSPKESKDRVERAKNWYLENVTDSLIIAINGQLCMKFGKNPSGQLNTLTDNTLALVIVYLYCLSEGVKDSSEIVLAYNEIAARMLGDDSIVEDDVRLSNLRLSSADLGFKLIPETAPGPLETCSFLNSTFHFDSRRYKWIQKPNFEKLFSNIYFNFKKSSWRYAYVKLCAARKLVFAFDEHREIIDDYIAYVINHHHSNLENEHSVDAEITYKAAISQFMPDSQNDFLVYGDESDNSLFSVVDRLKNFLTRNINTLSEQIHF